MDSGALVKPLDLLEKHCHARAVIKFESIFIGTKISLQVKLYECGVKLIDLGRKALLPRPTPSSNSLIIDKSNAAPLASFDEEDDGVNINDLVNDDDNGSLTLDYGDTAVDDILEEHQQIPKEEAPKKKKIVKTVKK